MKQIVIFCCVFSLLFFVASASADEQFKLLQKSISNLTKAFERQDFEEFQSNVDKIVNLYADLHERLTSEKIPPVQRFVAQKALRVETKQEALMLMNVISNREFIIHVLTSEDPMLILAQKALVYLIQKTRQFYASPVNISHLVTYDKQRQRDVHIKRDGVYILADIGIAGSYNKVIDAGETVELRIMLENGGRKDYLSTSGFLETKSRYAVIENEESVYDEIYPGQAVKPKQPFTITIHPECPNGHIIWFNMLIWDTDRGKQYQKFGLKVAKVGPLECDSVVIDDDMPGPSDPVVENGKLDEDEQIEFKMRIKNSGDVDIDDVKALLLCDEEFIEITESEHEYPAIPAHSTNKTKADYDFHVGEISEEAQNNGYVLLSVVTTGTVNGASYSWISRFRAELGYTEEQQAEQ